MHRREATFENLPSMMVQLLEKVDHLEKRLEEALSQKPETHEYLTVEQATDFLQIAKSTLYNKVHKKEIPYVKFKGGLRFKTSELRKFLEEQSVGVAVGEDY